MILVLEKKKKKKEKKTKKKKTEFKIYLGQVASNSIRCLRIWFMF